MVECFGRKPNWIFGMIPFFNIIGRILLSKSFSKSLPSVRSKLMGLYGVGKCFGLPDLWIKIITADFHIEGKYDNLSISL
jgi:hypothetical protein